MLIYIAIAVLLTAFLAWLMAINRRAAQYDRKQQQDLDKIRHMDSAELSDIINQYKHN